MKISFTKPCIGFILGFFFLLETNVNAQIQTSPGAFGNWTDPSNWVGGTPPSSGDIAQINSDAGINITTGITVTELRVAGTLQVGSLGTMTITKASGNALTFSSGTINLFGNMTLNGTSADVSHSGGTLTVNTGRTLSVTGHYNQTAGTLLVQSGGILLSNTLTLRSSTISGTGTITNNITINGSSTVDAGTLTTDAGTITVGGGGSLVTSNSGVVSCLLGRLTVNASGGITINSTTTISCKGFTVDPSASSITLNGNLDIGNDTWVNNGAVSPIGGKVYDFSSLSNTSSIALSGDINGPSADGSFSNNHPSTITNTGGSISASGTSNIYIRGTDGTDGFICGNNTFTFSGANTTITTYGNSKIDFGTSVTGATIPSITVNSGSLNLTGPTTITASSSSLLTVNSTASVSLLAGSTFNFNNAPSISNSGTLTNGATLTVNDLTLASASTALNNNGTIRVGRFFNNDKGSGGLVSGVGSTVDFIGSGGMSLNGSGTTAFHNLTFSGGGAVNGSASFSVAGNFTHSGSGSLTLANDFSVAANYANTSSIADAFTGNTVTFSGTGTLNAGSAGTTFNNITNTGGTRTGSGKIILRGILSVAGGTFDTGGSSVFTLKSDAAGTGSIGPIAGTLTGNMTIERYLSTGSSWKYLAFPISSSLSVADLQGAPSNFAVNGHFASGTSSTVGESMYVWTAGQQAWNGIGWGAPATSSTFLSNLTGYSAYAYVVTASTITLTGTPAQGLKQIPISNFGTGDNLIPNPYPCAIDFKKFVSRGGVIGTGMAIQTADNVGNTLAVYYNGGVTTAFPGNPTWNGEIAMGQSFWVTGLLNSTLDLVESDKYTGTAPFAGKTESQSPENYVRISLSSGGMTDQAIVRFSPQGSETYNSKLDFVKRFNGNPPLDGQTARSYLNLSTFKKDSDKPLVFSYLPLLDCNSGSVSVGVKVGDVMPGDHSLKFTDLETFNAGYKITLVDKFLNKQLAVSNGFSYSFTTTDAAATFGAGRFELKFEPQPIAVPAVTVVGTKLTTLASKMIQWYKDGKVITGATSETYTATESGIYTVKSGYSEKCQAESLPVVLTITGLDKESLIVAYPNPTGDILNITYPSTLKIEKVSLFDSKGAYVSDLNSLSATESTLSFDVSDRSAGLYILRLKSGNDTYSIKILKK